MKSLPPQITNLSTYKWGRMAAFLILAATLPMLVQCGRIGEYKSVSFSKAKLATPPTTLSQRDYPFDEKGRYRTDWVKSGSTKNRFRSSFRNVAASSSPTVTSPVSAPSPKKSSSSKTKKSSSSMTVAANTTRPSKPSPPPVYTPPPAPKPKPKPAPAKKQASYHTIAKGDTLWGISRRYKVSIAAIKSANGLSSDLIRPGQTLRLP